MSRSTIHATPNRSTGPRTEAGKANSSRNATKAGLFTAQPFIGPGEEHEFIQTRTSLLADLSPQGVLEESFAKEIFGATWRLRRCRLLEEQENEFCDSINRARAQAGNTLRRSLAELRKLQTERAIRLTLSDLPLTGVADTRQFLTITSLHSKQRLDTRKANGTDTLEGLMRQADKDLGMQTTSEAESENTPDSSFCKATNPDGASDLDFFEALMRQADRELGMQTVSEPEPTLDSSFCKTAASAAAPPDSAPRNAPCPCGSGIKYKRCCGSSAPAVLGPRPK